MSMLSSVRVSIAAALVALTPATAAAWDPSTTHVAMTQEAVLSSAMHLRWMDQSNLTRGVFTPVRLHPADLDPATRRDLVVAMRRVHDASGAAGLGGPGACPGPSAPPSTQVRCIEGDVWEFTALSWMKLGVILETAPRTRLLHHFANAQDPSRSTWSDAELPATVLRNKARRSEGALARAANRTAFSGGATSAVGWLADTEDRWAPPATLRHLQRASTEASERDRERELALGLVGLGALLHVVQDQSVPAHARGDLTAFFAPLSPTPGDRGLPLQEYVRVLHGRNRVPAALPLQARVHAARTRGEPLALSLHEHLVGAAGYDGLSRWTARRFWSESSLPAPRGVDPGLSPADAAQVFLAESDLDPVETTRGALLTGWPAETGYLVTRTGRALAAYDTDDDGRVRLFLDRRVYRDQAAHLLPAGIEASASVIDLLLPAFPAHEVGFDSGIVDVDLRGSTVHAPVLTVLWEDSKGRRTPVQQIRLRAGQRNHIVDAFVPEASPQAASGEGASESADAAPALATDENARRLVLRLEGVSAPEHGLPLATSTYPAPPAAAVETMTAPAATPDAGAPDAGAPDADAPDADATDKPGSDDAQRGPSQSELISPFGGGAPGVSATPPADPAEPDPAPKTDADAPATSRAPEAADKPASDAAPDPAPPADPASPPADAGNAA